MFSLKKVFFYRFLGLKGTDLGGWDSVLGRYLAFILLTKTIHFQFILFSFKVFGPSLKTQIKCITYSK